MRTTLTLILLSLCQYSFADNESPDCSILGHVALQSGSGVRIEVDGENAGCNADGTRYSFGNVIGPVRIYPGLRAITQPESNDLLIDTPLVFVRTQHPLGGTQLSGRWITRDGTTIVMTLSAGSFEPLNVLQVHDFIVLREPSTELDDNVLYQEWQTRWTTASPMSVFGQVVEDTNGNVSFDTFDRPVGNVGVEAYHCRSRDGLIARTTTDSNGEFHFDDLEDGYLQLRFLPPADLRIPENGPIGQPLVFPNGFTGCVDYTTPNTPSRMRTGGLFGRSSDRPQRALLVPAL